ncbi:MAG: hypothetical protein JWO77_604 [Ilumatobacteraceae bacterium]|nr:hypothetical protein [Ilumatobacteraceae bacterium]
MPMRQDCKFFESRTYANGETVRKCDLDLAPEAPWRCPADCQGYQRRLADVNWQHGTLVTPATPEAPVDLDEHGDEIAALLDEAENIINAAGPRIMAEVDAEREQGRRSRVAGRLRRFFRRKPGS